ncbi:DUF4212 domain-containing protein [Azonexus sp.]|jgi:putative solute:sodium symporter small subunit|uniref:DUF4212 domain-containing protein n=1 Tax=Azonexus sp. TaxID=1872668 RepID=UPI0028335DF9|nr:DUF4212 domain-containing protein [Azonexus sp.]MDR1995868.1 DUF4212 domain-containing protein [Azonexus sp.]
MKQPRRATYWRQTQRLTAVLGLFWVLVTFGVSWFARELNNIVVVGFPLGFYMAAQGIPLLFLLIIWFYNQRMRALEAEFGIDDE